MENIDLFGIYNTEEKCIGIFKKWRDATGVHCKRCYSTQHCWISTRCRYRCKECRWETTLRSGTALECSKLPYRYWVYTAILLSAGKKPISAKELQQQLGHKYYLPVWSLLHKLRISMGLMSSLTGLAAFVEHGHVVLPVIGRENRETYTKKSKAGLKGVKVHLAASEAGSFDGRHDPEDRSTNYQGMSAIRMMATVGTMHSPTKRFSHIGEAGLEEVHQYFDLPQFDVIHKADLEKKLSWLQIMASNARRNFQGIYHTVSEKYLQNYLCEFCFMTNRRHLGFEKFNALMGLMVRQPWHQAQVQFPEYSVRPPSQPRRKPLKSDKNFQAYAVTP